MSIKQKFFDRNLGSVIDFKCKKEAMLATQSATCLQLCKNAHVNISFNIYIYIFISEVVIEAEVFK